MPMLSFWLRDLPFLRVLLIVLVALFVCRLLAATILPCLCEKRRSLLLGIVLLLLVPPLEFFIGEPMKYGLSETIFVWFLLSPFFILGALGIVRRFRWHHVLLSCVLETLFLPAWLIVVFTIGLSLEGDV